MKIFRFCFDASEANWIFSPIRTKTDYIVLLMRTIKLMLANIPTTNSNCAGEILLKSEKMSRLIFSGKDKIFSIAFPFFIEETDSGLRFYSNNYLDINHKTTSQILGLFRDEKILDHSDVFMFADPIDSISRFDPDIWSLLRDIITSEDGYLRYDHDPKNANGHLHPLHHLDIFYTTPSTFKIGLNAEIAVTSFEDVINLRTDCYYLGKP